MSTKPRWDTTDALRRARVAYRLATKHLAQLETRLTPGLLPQLAADRTTLGDGSVATLSASGTARAATATERSLAERGHTFVMRVRNAVKRSVNPDPALRTALGVGDNLRPGDTRAVLAALGAIAAQAAALAPHGVLPADITKAQDLAAKLAAADKDQAGALDARAGTVEDRNDTQRRLEAAVDEISARGSLAFDDDTQEGEVIADRFDRLVASGGPTAEDETDAGGEPAPAPPA